jgi:hypothetical protein
MNVQDKNSLARLVQCTCHMCSIRVHWHVKANYKEYWGVKITVINLNYRMNYSQWNLVAKNSNFNSLTSISSFNYTDLNFHRLTSEHFIPRHLTFFVWMFFGCWQILLLQMTPCCYEASCTTMIFSWLLDLMDMFSPRSVPRDGYGVFTVFCWILPNGSYV